MRQAFPTFANVDNGETLALAGNCHSIRHKPDYCE
jgi:hypothetical protein